MDGWDQIVDPEGLERVGGALAASDWVALSGESDAIHAYHGRLCLLQVASPRGLFAVDTLALRGRPFALRALDRGLHREGLRVLVHGGEELVAGLKRDLQLAPPRLWDAQQAAVLLGWPRTGYRALVQQILGIRLPPPRSQNWALRPLPSDAIDHALSDVRYLERVAAALLIEIERHDLSDELSIACAEVAWTPVERGRFDPDGYYRLKGAHRLGSESLRVLRATWLWREGKARDLDLPPGRVLPNRELLEIARRPPQALAGLRQIQFHSKLLFGDREELLGAIGRAISEPSPLPPRRERPPPDPARKARARRLKLWRREEAARRGVGLQAVLPQKALRYLAIHGAGALMDVPALGRRRRERYAARLVELCAGEG